MNREIRFRGKSIMDIEEMDNMGFEHDNGWVIGNLINGKSPFIVGPVVEADQEYLAHEWWVPVDLETVGQYTGLKDKNGKEICEKDVLENPEGIRGVVEYVTEHASLLVYCVVENNAQYYYIDSAHKYKVIGNIYENPYLLEGESHDV